MNFSLILFEDEIFLLCVFLQFVVGKFNDKDSFLIVF